MKVSDGSRRKKIEVCSKAVIDAIQRMNKKDHTSIDHVVSLGQQEKKDRTVSNTTAIIYR